jgi:hypothetical protein
VFCVPQNDKLLGYWNTVADRLFKIQHCMNIEGTVRQLPPFEPPIDPALLVRAAAAGVDISSVLNDLAAGAPPYRFTFMHQKALELCGEVRALGANLLSALEKRDSEALAALRSTQETGLLQAVRNVREQQVAEARAGREALELSRRVLQARYDYYNTVPFLNPMEAEHLKLLGSTLPLQAVQSGVDLVGNLSALVPNTKIGPTDPGVTFGGDNLAQAIRAFSSYLGSMISILGTTGSLTATMGGYARRADEWKLQRDVAAKELKQLDKQLVGAEVREAITGLELANHDRQLADSRQVESFLKTKYTSEELFGWMSGQLSSLHFQAYRLAYDVAKRAEGALKLELGDDGISFIQFGYWDTLKKGLLAGERLALDLRRMEAAYLERNVRDPELTRHMSWALLSPRELLRLQELSTCEIDVPEALFDLDHAGQYFRRIKSVSVTIPCVTGPYVGVPCKLTLLKSKIRISKDVGPGYLPTGADDARFHQMPPPSESLFLSSAQGDSGLFETNLRDERFLPFEGHGAVSTWKIDLPNDFRPFDYKTISDVILHVRYTAKDGKDALKNACDSTLRDALNAVEQRGAPAGFARLFVLPQELSDRFHVFLHPPAGARQHEITVPVTAERFPFRLQSKTIRPLKLEVFIKVKAPSPAARAAIKVAIEAPGGSPSALAISDDMGLLRAEKGATTLGDRTLFVWQETGRVKGILPPDTVIEDVCLICYYRIA